MFADGSTFIEILVTFLLFPVLVFSFALKSGNSRLLNLKKTGR